MTDAHVSRSLDHCKRHRWWMHGTRWWVQTCSASRLAAGEGCASASASDLQGDVSMEDRDEPVM